MARTYQGAEWPDRDKYVSRQEASKILGIPSERILPMIRRGEVLEGLQRGKWWYVTRESIAAYQRMRGF